MCGSSLFRDHIGSGFLAIAAGTLDQPTGSQTVRHIFTADRADCYDITDDLDQLPESMLAAPPL